MPFKKHQAISSNVRPSTSWWSDLQLHSLLRLLRKLNRIGPGLQTWALKGGKNAASEKKSLKFFFLEGSITTEQQKPLASNLDHKSPGNQWKERECVSVCTCVCASVCASVCTCERAREMACGWGWKRESERERENFEGPTNHQLFINSGWGRVQKVKIMQITECSTVEWALSNEHCRMSTVEWALSNEHCRMSTVEWELSNEHWWNRSAHQRLS